MATDVDLRTRSANPAAGLCPRAPIRRQAVGSRCLQMIPFNLSLSDLCLPIGLRFEIQYRNCYGPVSSVSDEIDVTSCSGTSDLDDNVTGDTWASVNRFEQCRGIRKSKRAPLWIVMRLTSPRRTIEFAPKVVLGRFYYLDAFVYVLNVVVRQFLTPTSGLTVVTLYNKKFSRYRF